MGLVFVYHESPHRPKKLPQSARSADSPLFVEGAFGLMRVSAPTTAVVGIGKPARQGLPRGFRNEGEKMGIETVKG